MSFLSKLFGRAPTPPKAEAKPVTHKDYLIYPEPISEQGGYRIAGRIEKEVDGETKVSSFIRADTYSSEDTARDASISKAKQVIDQMGDSLFRS